MTMGEERIVLTRWSPLMAIPFLRTLWRVPKTVRGMAIVIDDEGIPPFDGRRQDTIAWSEIAAHHVASLPDAHVRNLHIA